MKKKERKEKKGEKILENRPPSVLFAVFFAGLTSPQENMKKLSTSLLDTYHMP
jgi:hypothetical protein